MNVNDRYIKEPRRMGTLTKYRGNLFKYKHEVMLVTNFECKTRDFRRTESLA